MILPRKWIRFQTTTHIIRVPVPLHKFSLENFKHSALQQQDRVDQWSIWQHNNGIPKAPVISLQPCVTTDLINRS
jgi:hypothetical protein